MIYDPYEEVSRSPLHDEYSRYSQPVRTRAEHILSKINVRGFIARLSLTLTLTEIIEWFCLDLRVWATLLILCEPHLHVVWDRHSSFL